MFDIFNYAINNKTIIVWTSDKNIDTVLGIENRMKSRFHSGLYLPITKPDFDTMKMIIKQKTQILDNNFVFANDALDFIVKKSNYDIRRLIGLINQIFFFHNWRHNRKNY